MEGFAKCTWAGLCGHDICLPEFCDQYEAAKITNADRIRAMSDDELAEYLVYHNPYSTISNCLKWLQQPAKEDA